MSSRLFPSLSLAAVAALGILGSAGAAQAAPDASTTSATTSATASSVAAPAAEDCGREAVLGTIEHPAITVVVPAVTHLEWRWSRQVPTTDTRYERVVSPAQGVRAWSRVVEVVEEEYVVRVIDRAYEAAVPEEGHFETRTIPGTGTLVFEYVQQKNGNTRWEPAGWNAGAGGLGWSPTGRTELRNPQTEQVWVVTRDAVAEVPELSHLESVWVLLGTPGPAGGTATGETRVVSSTPESTQLPEGATPAGAGWVPGAFIETVAAIIDSYWVPEGGTPAAGYAPTTDTRPGVPVEEITPGTSEAAPDGAGWDKVAGSEVLITTEEAFIDVVEPARVEDFILIPATEPCPTGGETGGESDTDNGGDNGDGGDDGGDDAVVPTGVEGLEVTATAAEAGALPDTGAPVGLWGVALGAGGVLGGLTLVARSRRTA